MSRRQKHYWLVCQDDNGKPYLIYGGRTEDECRHKGLEILGGLDFQVKMYATTDAGTASSMHRGKRLEETHSLNAARERLGHDRSLRRMQRRTRRRSGEV